MTAQDLAARHAANPKSPLFARLAEAALSGGDPRRGAELCLEGLQHHPRYGTAHLVLARCYETLGRDVQALLEYRKALHAVPDNAALLASVARVEARRNATPPAPERQAPHTGGELSPPAEAPATATPPAAEEPEAAEETPPPATPATRIVTATLAEIYASQGEYSEAIAAYQRLLVLRPAEADGYRRRLQELEELLRVHRELNGQAASPGTPGTA
jgi:tetratricopeptide (TPR) repeat protein